jgi:hypothetical protein
LFGTFSNEKKLLLFLMKSGSVTDEPIGISGRGVISNTYSFMLSMDHFEFGLFSRSTMSKIPSIDVFTYHWHLIYIEK